MDVYICIHILPIYLLFCQKLFKFEYVKQDTLTEFCIAKYVRAHAFTAKPIAIENKKVRKPTGIRTQIFR